MKQKVPDNLPILLEEGLSYVDAWTPTEINMGGCGIFAQLLAEELDKCSIPYKIYAIYFNKGDDNLKSIEAINKCNNGEEVSLKKRGAEHVVLNIKDEIWIDSTGICNAEVLQSIDKLELSKQVLDKLVIEGQWNPTFDKDCIPEIKSKLDEVFVHLKDFHSGIFKFPTKGDVKWTEHTKEYQAISNIFGD